MEFFTIASYDSCRILASMLKDQQSVIQQLIDVRALASHNSEDAAHDEA
jgi:hypothetical protein